MAHRITSRTRARKRAVDTIFEAEQKGALSQEGLRDLLTQRLQVTTAQTPLPPYAIEIIEGVSAHVFEIDELLTLHTTTRDFDRLPAVDRAILRVGAWEIVWNPEVPPISAIDEAVTIAKEISTDDSPAVVNGILDAVRKDASRVREFDEALQAALAPSSTDSEPGNELDVDLHDNEIEQLNNP